MNTETLLPPWEVATPATPITNTCAELSIESPTEALPEPVAALEAEIEQITLTEGQEAALQAFLKFMMDPMQHVFVLAGYSGTGKSTLVKSLLKRLPGMLSTIQLMGIDIPDYDINLTATTNKACEALNSLSKLPVKTIQSHLSLRVHTNYETMETTLQPARDASVHVHELLFIDEASYIDHELLKYIFRFTSDCKIVFLGDPAQLTPVNCSTTPVFSAGYQGAQLTQVMRQISQDGRINQILDLSTKLRNMVNTGENFEFEPDGESIIHLDREAFDEAVVAEFTRPNWAYHDSKVLTWTNKKGIAYNHGIQGLTKGTPVFQKGDYAVCNSYVNGGRGRTVKTDQMVYVSGASDVETVHGVEGRRYSLDVGEFFCPNSLDDWKAAVKHFQAKKLYGVIAEMESYFIDLRAAYACTINKSQGSTYDRVYIDLEDVRKCKNPNLLARLLYVGVSRARHQVFLTGSIG
jgi:hypothetical protein